MSYSATGGGPSQGWSGGAGIPVLDDHGDDDQGDDDQGDDDGIHPKYLRNEYL